MQTVRADQQRPLDVEARAITRLDQRPDAGAAGMLAVARNLHARSNSASAETLDDRVVEEHLQAAAVHRVLRPLVAGAHAARLGVHLDRKSTPLNSSHSQTSYAAFCLKKNKDDRVR